MEGKSHQKWWDFFIPNLVLTPYVLGAAVMQIGFRLCRRFDGMYREKVECKMVSALWKRNGLVGNKVTKKF